MKQKGRRMEKMTQSDLSRKLKRRRKEIDLIDRKLLTLLNKRLYMALEIGVVKKEMGGKIYDPRREKEVLGRLKMKNRGPLKEEDLEKIFRRIMVVCRKSQNRIKSKK
jgi:chorismate mutase/prephenate dehydratase